MANPNIPALVRSIREKTGWTQEKLAQKVGVSFSTVNCWERGKRRPQPFLLKKLLELAGETSVEENDQDDK
ncbi:MAG TPA: XRE family transcriptional regulator [Desulfobacterales bacterium]|nr:XRE family transcriptional regulator [Desulfobacterales bacterium]